MAETILASGGKASALGCHVGEMDDIMAVFKALEKEHDHLDILVNNAATNPYFGPISDTDPAAFQKTVDVNIRGYFFMCALGAKLRAKNGGSIINVSSVNGAIPAAMQGIYSITKTAVLAMTKMFARECAAQGVRGNAILPGASDTKFAAALVQTRPSSR